MIPWIQNSTCEKGRSATSAVDSSYKEEEWGCEIKLLQIYWRRKSLNITLVFHVRFKMYVQFLCVLSDILASHCSFLLKYELKWKKPIFKEEFASPLFKRLSRRAWACPATIQQVISVSSEGFWLVCALLWQSKLWSVKSEGCEQERNTKLSSL